MAIVMAFFLHTDAKAQDFQSAAGVRVSWGGLLSYQYKIKESLFAEGILSYRWGGPTVTGLIQHYQPAFNVDGLFWYAGGGMHLGVNGRNNVYNPESGTNEELQINLGVALDGGFMYQFPSFPVVVAVDYMPAFYFTGERWFVPEGLGLTLRYIIN